MTKTATKTFLDEIPPLNWDDFEGSSRQSIAILRRLANDRYTLRTLLESVPDTPALWDKCESHSLDDKIVIYDGLKTNLFRIRFRLATAYQDERPHTHRFTFSTYIIRGAYFQSLFSTDSDTEEGVNAENLRPVVERQEKAGSAFTIRHNTLHSTIAPPDTISLILRAPPAKKRAVIAHKPTGEIWWREGAETESAERREAVKLPRKRYDDWCRRLETYGIV